MYYGCHFVMSPILVFILHQLFTFRDNVSHSLLSLPTHSTHSTDLSLSMTFLMFLVLKACSCAVIIIPSVSFFKPLRLNHSQDFEPLTSSVATKYWLGVLYFCRHFHVPFFSLPCSIIPSLLTSLSSCSSLLSTYVFKLLISMLTASATLINSLPPVFLFT